MSRHRLAVDWDGTCVTDAWPNMGTWNPGAVEALHELSRIVQPFIYTSRIAGWHFHDESIPRTPGDVQMSINQIREMLDEEGLTGVGIWTRDFKPGALAYIDDKAMLYNGRPGAWRAITDKVRMKVQSK